MQRLSHPRARLAVSAPDFSWREVHWSSGWFPQSRVETVPDKGMLLRWSGTFSDGLFDGDIRNWMNPGTRALNEQLDEILPIACAAGSSFGFVPHHSHFLSDVTGQMRLWHARQAQGFATVLYPSGVIAASMIGDLEDHLRRAIEMVAPRCDLCILEDIALRDSEGGQAPQPARMPWGKGDLPHDFIVNLLDRFLPPTVPILCMNEAVIG